MVHSVPHHPLLIAPSDWAEPVIRVSDDGSPALFTLQDAFNYHGYDAPGGVVLGFRLLQRAFALLAPDSAYPERKKLSLFTSFPGLGLKDTMELVTRMVTEGRYCVDSSYCDPRAQEGVAGRFYYRFTLTSSAAGTPATVELAPVEGYPSPEFIRLGKASKRPGFSAADAEAWKTAKFSLANTLLGAPAEALVRVL
ncbi:hypothetical protein LJC23_00735 [Desulfovibrio sp. OttesenSCG-928-I05]|nr:hypothetical protein [Desulfovibrio sp. OttesenSCG-928-I05]